MNTNAVVIGAGVIGLAIGRALAQRGLETVVLEKAGTIGSETSSRNSEVIHAGLYYPPGSAKARYCTRGKKLLYDYLQSHGIPYRRCGKIIVAADSADCPRLDAIAERARRNGVDDLRELSRDDIRQLESSIEAAAGLLSPSTGILDSHQFLLSLQGELEAAGGIVALATPALAGTLGAKGQHSVSCGGSAPTTVTCKALVNATGLWARETWVRLDGGEASAMPPDQFFAKGHYYAYSGKAPFSQLIYPLPTAGGLGIHATLDMAGQVRFGPDVHWVDGIDYTFDEGGKAGFIAAIRRYFPGLVTSRLTPAYTGIRPKVVGPGSADADFAILAEPQHGIPGFVSLHGIESPGLTASLAIAEDVATAIAGR
ncbi:NAD(P)/FAD-dependent oxidoreductase [Parahaliea mediterranea]|uniref:NAD(P)/FAD-dependent oxidoreductase n=1 Tax=Parahaliea mediterranea TaxID=651086 RepID=UPI0032199620